MCVVPKKDTTKNKNNNVDNNDNDFHKISHVPTIYLTLLFLLMIQMVLFQTFVMTLIFILSILLYVIVGYPQPTLQWENEYFLPMAEESSSSYKDMVVAITGSTSGIGMELTRLLAKNGITVIAIGRSESKLKALQAEYPKSIEIVICDLTDLESVAKAADEMVTKYDRLDVLVNNAGIQLGMQNLWKWGLSSTKQGHDLVFGVNYLSHFLLTEKLIPLLTKQSTLKPKILQISSSYHWTVNGDDLRPTTMISSSSSSSTTTNDDNNDKKKKYNMPVANRIGGSHGFVLFRGIRQYANSKLAQILHARALKRRYHQGKGNNNGTVKLDVVSACPAWVGTQIAAKKGSWIHSVFEQLAFPVEGHGINSFLYAIFDQENYNNNDNNNDDNDDDKHDFYVNTTITNPNLVDLMPAWMSHVLPIRDAIGSICAFSMLAFQRMVPAVKRTNASSHVSYDKELQEALYEWSLQAVAEYM